MDKPRTANYLRLVLAHVVVAVGTSSGCAPSVPVRPPCDLTAPSSLVIVIEENHGYAQIIGNADAPFINYLANIGASSTQSFGVSHPSQPNYLALFSGSTQGVVSDATYPHEQFTGPNLGAKLLAPGLTFGGYSEGLPEVGWDGDSAGDDVTGYYRRKHNPWVNWQDATVPLPLNKLPSTVNLPFTSFPVNYADLPRVAIVVPNQLHDMHDGSIAEADAWLEQNIGPYVEWSQAHNGLLMLTWDEDDGPEFNHIVTVFVGPQVRKGRYAGVINHVSVLRAVEDLCGLPHDAKTSQASPVSCDVWQTAD